MRYMVHQILKNIIKKNPIKCSNNSVFSYGKFLKENPNSTKKQRLEAIKKFLDSTR